MQRIGLTLAAAVALLACGAFASRLQAAPLAPQGLRAAIGSLDMIEKAQVFVWHGRRYCWYDDGWRGAGFYWCGYAKRHGLGWGGSAGWNGWQQGVSPQGKSVAPQGGQRQSVKPQGVQPKSTSPQGGQQQNVKPQDDRPKSTSPQGSQQQNVKPQDDQPKSASPQSGRQQGGEPKGGQNK